MAPTIDQQIDRKQKQLAAFPKEEYEGMQAVLAMELQALRQQRDVRTRWADACKSKGGESRL